MFVLLRMAGDCAEKRETEGEQEKEIQNERNKHKRERREKKGAMGANHSTSKYSPGICAISKCIRIVEFNA